METGKLIKQLRKEKKMNAETLAERVGVHPATIYRYEKGDIEKIPYQVLLPIAEVLDCSPLDLLGIDGDREGRLLAAFRSLPVEKQDAAIIMIEGML